MPSGRFHPDLDRLSAMDPQPANFAWRDGRAVGLFDWDAARPGQPVDDVAYALLWFSPFNADEAQIRGRGFHGEPDRRARAEALLDGYGWDQPIDVVEAAVTRHAQAIDEVVWLGERGHEPHATLGGQLSRASWSRPAQRSGGDLC